MAAAAAASAPAESPAESPAASDQPELDARASRLVQAAQRASEVAKRAYTAGIDTTQVRMRQVSDAVLENSQRAKGSSKDFLSRVHVKAAHYAGVAQERAGLYAGKAQERAGVYTGKVQDRAIEYRGNVSRAIQQSRDGEGEKVGFPLSVMVWCSTLCGGSKKKKSDTIAEREMEPESSSEKGEEFSSELLAKSADEYTAQLDEETNKLEEAVADREKTNAETSAA